MKILNSIVFGSTLGVIAVLSSTASASIEIDGQELQVVDMHLHAGRFGTMNPDGKAFIAQVLPPFLKPYLPVLLGSQPYEEHVGIQDQSRFANVDHGVLYAVYTQHTTGYYTNEDLLEALEDPRNEGWAWGFASINLDDVSNNPMLLEDRLSAMRSYLEQRPDLFIGIKLAHAHQGVTLDDEASFQIYELAGELGVPVLLHTGLSPFPNTQDTSGYYDPAYLNDIVSLFDGNNGPRVDFVFAHSGQGDARSVDAALSLAESSDNVWLELSALGRPLTLDEQGNETDTEEEQYPYVLEQILARGLVDRTLYASDGPQSSGFLGRYLEKIVGGMQDAGYTTADIAAVLAENFFSVYPRTSA